MPDLSALLAHWGYAALFLVVVLGNLGLPVPEESILALAGYAVWRGTLSLPLVLAVGIASAVVGDNLGYWIGRRYGRTVLERYGRWTSVTPERLRKVTSVVTRYGAWAVLVGRFVAGLRFLAGPLAGAAGMPPATFLIANVLGALLFVPYAVGLGYAIGYGFGAYVEQIEQMRTVLGYGALGVGLVALALLRRRRRARGAPKTSYPSPDPGEACPATKEYQRAGRLEWLLTARQAIPRVFTLVRHLRPTICLPSVAAIDETFLDTQGVRAIIWDVDGTLLVPGAREVAADHREHVRRLFGSPRLRHAIVSNCGEARYRALGRVFPDVPIVSAYRGPEGPIYRVLYAGLERWDPHPPAIDSQWRLQPLRKPNAEVVQFIVAFLACAPELVVMVGDQYFTDIAGANLAGIRSIKVPTLGRAHFPLAVRWFQRIEGVLSTMLSAASRR